MRLTLFLRRTGPLLSSRWPALASLVLQLLVSAALAQRLVWSVIPGGRCRSVWERLEDPYRAVTGFVAWVRTLPGAGGAWNCRAMWNRRRPL